MMVALIRQNIMQNKREVNKMEKNMKCSIIIPAYNEEKGISKVLTDLKNILDNIHLDYEIIVVDDGSTDKTKEIISKHDFVRLIQHSINRGYGAALKTGIKAAKGDLILITDADGTYPNEYIPKLLEYSDKYDMVVGARTGKNVNISLFRKPVKIFLNKLANYLTDTNIPDLNSGMRLFRKKDSMKYFHIISSGFSFTTTITLSYLCNDLTIKYVPIDYHKRHGSSKIRPFRDTINFVQLIVRTIAYFNPLKIFLPVSIFLFISGFIILLYQLISSENVGELSVLLIISSFQIGFLGLLADLIVKLNKIKNDG